jgi:hypothetical protein
VHHTPSISSTGGRQEVAGVGRTGSSAKLIGRKRGYITRAGVENVPSGNRRKSWRQGVATDIEDLDGDEDDAEGWRHRPARRQRSSVARVHVGRDDNNGYYDNRHGSGLESDDALSVFSEPAAILYRSRSLNTLSQQQPRHIQLTNPVIEYKPTSTPLALYQQPLMSPQPPSFTLAHIDTRINPMSSGLSTTELVSPDLIEGLDPELQDASKKGTNYNITLTLKPVISSRPGSSMQAAIMTSNDATATTTRQAPVTQRSSYSAVSRIDTTTPEVQTVRPQSRLELSSRSPMPVVRTHSRIDTSRDEIRIEPISPTRSHTPRRSRSLHQPAEGQIGFDVEVLSDNEPDDVVQVSINPMTQAPAYNMELRSSLEFNYAPQGNRDDVAPVENVYEQEALHYINGTYREAAVVEDRLPRIQRGSFLIRNSIDAANPQMVIDAASDSDFTDDDDDDDEDQLSTDNINMFDSNYRQTKENPLYSSDPDISCNVDEQLPSPTRRTNKRAPGSTEKRQQHAGPRSEPTVTKKVETKAQKVALVESSSKPRQSTKGNQTDRTRTVDTGVQPAVVQTREASTSNMESTRSRKMPDNSDDEMNHLMEAGLNKKLYVQQRPNSKQMNSNDMDDLGGPMVRRLQVNTHRKPFTTQDNVGVPEGRYQMAQTQRQPLDEVDNEPVNIEQKVYSVQHSVPVDEEGFNEVGSAYLAGKNETRHGRANGSGWDRQSWSTTGGRNVADEVAVSRSRGLATQQGRNEDEQFWDEFDINSSNANRGELATAGLSQAALRVREMYEDGDFDHEVSVSREFGMRATKPKSSNVSASRHFARDSRPLSVSETISRLDVRSLLLNAPATSVRQTIDVERLEDEIVIGPQTASSCAPVDLPSVGLDCVMTDYDTVSEQVELNVTDNGLAVITARVRCERTVPIRGSADMFKKSSVIVTKRIEVDLTVSSQRRTLWSVIKGTTTTSTSGAVTSHTLNDTDTMNLYKKFMTLADLNKSNRTVN